jgi:hypothetical protein
MRIFTLILSLLLIIIAVPTRGETKTERIQKKVTDAIEIRQKTQKKKDEWAGKKAELAARYRSLNAEKKYFLKIKAKTENILNAYKSRVAELERKAKESERIRKELQSFLESVVMQLEGFIKRDLPFLLKERSGRLFSIKEVLIQPDKTPAEKYRRVMEALQVETEYGRTVEVYNETIDLNGQKTVADILRLGRLSLFFQTPDRKIVGHYDQVTDKWVLLTSRYRRDIKRAVEIARRERSIELVKLPIGRIIVP